MLRPRSLEQRTGSGAGRVIARKPPKNREVPTLAGWQVAVTAHAERAERRSNALTLPGLFLALTFALSVPMIALDLATERLAKGFLIGDGPQRLATLSSRAPGSEAQIEVLDVALSQCIDHSAATLMRTEFPAWVAALARRGHDDYASSVLTRAHLQCVARRGQAAEAGSEVRR